MKNAEQIIGLSTESTESRLQREIHYITSKAPLDYWQKQLLGISLLHHFPVDNPRPEKPSFKKCTLQQRISKELVQKITKLCARYDVTLFTFLETAFALLLSRYNHEQDVLIGTFMPEIVHDETQTLINSFTNLRVIRTDLSDQPTFSELLKQNHRTILEAYAQQDLPFEQLAAVFNPDQNLNYHPIVQIAFTPEKTSQHRTVLQSNGEAYPPLKNRLDLDIRIYEEDTDEIYILWHYATELFENVTIGRLIANYQTLLTNITGVMNSCENPEQEPVIHHIPFLSDAEKHTLLHEWSGPRKVYQSARCFHELFEEQAEKVPENTALIFGDDSLSYRELNEQSNQLAHYLIEQGVKPDMLVAFCLSRSLQAMVALLGILKAGGAYVPLDPTYPQARLQYMLEHSEVSLILTETQQVEKLPVSQQKVIYLDAQELRSHLQTQPMTNITDRSAPLTENHLVFVSYTSGSTGKPKGVMVKHKGSVNMALSEATLFGMDSNSRVLQFASLSFPAITMEIGMAFPYGATLFLISEEQQRTPELLDDIVEKYQITHALLPQALLPHLDFEKWRSVSCLLLGGEALPSQIALRWKPGRKLFNVYGAVELSSMVTAGLLSDDRVTIGKPLPNIVARVLDPLGELVPVGAVGELYIGGVQLAKGYLNAPEITKKQFIRAAAGLSYADDNTENRLYRTGDLARWTSNGQLEYVGRADSLVKIRGYRVELGEIEEALSKHDALNSAVVITYGEGDDKRLIAYVCPNEQWLAERVAEFNIGDVENKIGKYTGSYRDLSVIRRELSELLESALRKQLPDYMVPSLYIPLERMPLTPTKKVDKKALPIPNESDLHQQDYIVPRDELEETLCQIWQNHLNVNQVGIKDNFFALGGHSLLAAKITASIKSCLNNNISIYQLLTNPTIAQIADLIKKMKAPEIMISEPMQTACDEKIALDNCQKVFFPLIQQRWLEQSLHVSITLLVNSKIDLSALKKSLNAVLGRHESLRLKFYQQHGQIFSRPDNEIAIDFQIIELQFKGKDKEKLIHEIDSFWKEEKKIPFDIYHEPLIRAFLFPVSEISAVLLFDIHHMAFDGWSINIFLKELLQLYAAYSQGKELTLQPAAMQYSEYIHTSKQLQKTERCQKQLQFWQHQFADLNNQYDHLPDFSTHAASNGHFNFRDIRISPTLNKAVSRYCEANKITPYMLFMALFHTCIFMNSGESQIIISTPQFDRASIESQQAIGILLSFLLIKSNLNKEMSLNDIIQQISQFSYKALENSDINISSVIDFVGEKIRDVMFNIMFIYIDNYLDVANDEKELFDNLGVEPIMLTETPIESLGMCFFNQPEEPICELGYNTELYSEEWIDNLIKYYEQLMNIIISGREHESIRHFYH
ncbi:amino acid adenylation domain-containing protein [Xenorhabdus cabanillasii]|uniref:Amino acid adenylation domain-containing protein n=1 Tax=Xenorhabdus cabanillasii TaxID=351673 RepID=A0A3D9UEN0_9GAMM|nr:non-ribosomal peptide synthetase [Xenorhabdus cabanillasii]REF27958.1 amino acid adenylation domain-containing protein [Xenorhabdus cabanillasii]